MDTWKKVLIGGGALLGSAVIGASCILSGLGPRLLNQASQYSQANSIDHARGMEQQAAMDRALGATLTAMVPAGQQATPAPGEIQPGALGNARFMEQTAAANRAMQATIDSAVATAMAGYATATPTPGAIAQTPIVSYTTTSMPTSIGSLDDVYNIIISGPRLKCCKDCNYGILIDEVNKLTGGSGIPTYLQINDDTNTLEVEYGSKVFNLPQSEATIDSLLNLTDGYQKEIVTTSGDNFRSAVASSGHTLEEFASVLGGSYLDELMTASKVTFANEPSGGFIPLVKIYQADGSRIDEKVKDASGKADFGKYFQLLDLAGVPSY